MTQSRQPILNAPAVIVALLALLLLVHLVRTLLLSPDADRYLLILFAFIPARLSPSILPGTVWPGGWPADIWTFVTYAFLHADWAHLGVNSIWLLAFGSPLARRFGVARFLAFFAVTAAAGAAAHLAVYADRGVPVIGASAAISGMMAGAMRFVFQSGGPLFRRGADDSSYRMPAVPLGAALRNPRILTFLAVWLGINLVFGLGGVSFGGEEQAIAWQAHIGGFAAGLLLFGFFDPVPPGPWPEHESPPPDVA